ncbi:hypothetical protein EV426DRAFT_352969 [Tirmania nivea]|nr:hypothetical protein EV426DRAFT_352969 [Tirmania nivea]
MDRTRSPDLANDAIPTKTSIASQYERCIYTFSQLYERLESTDYDHDILSRIEDEIGRFRVWAAQVGVRRSGSASLNYRLREAPHVHSRVSELIDEIQEDLENGLNIVDDLSYSGPEWEISLGVDPETGSDNGTKSSELESLLKDIRHITTSLYKISTAIRNPVPRERLAKFAAIDVSHFKLSDIADIRQKFPEAPEYLVKRLGEANCKRRQLLQFYKIHHHNSAQYNDLPLPSDEGNASHRPKASRQFDIVIGDRGNTTTCFKSDATKLTPLQSQPATTIKPDTVVLDELGPDDDLLSEIFYAVSTNEHIRIQASPASHTEAAFNGESFQCPYCYQITKVENLHSWKIHVCRDLQPYVCTQVGCQDHEKLYDSQYSWYAHEVQAHRSEWYCNACSRPFDKEPFKTHLRNVHGMNCDEEITVMVEQCIREKETPEACVMCGVHLCVADIRKHLGRHLLDAAMLLLPYLVPDEDPRSKIEGIEASTDNVKPQTPNSLIYPVLELKSNPGRGSDSKNFHDSFSSKLLMSTLGGISAGDYSETHHEAEDCVAPRPVQPGKPNLSKNSRVLMGLTTATPAAQRIEMPVAFEDVNNTHALPQTITGATVQLLVGLDHAESSSDPFARLAELYPYSPIAVEGEGIIEGNEVTVGPARLADKETCSSKFEAVPGHPLITIECTGLRDDSGRGVGLGKVTGVWREAGSGESRHDEMVAYMAREREDAKGTLNAEGDMNKWVAKRERKVFMEGKGISSGSSLRTTATNLAEQAQCWSTLAGQAPHSQPNSVVGTRPTFTEQAFHSRPRLDYQVSQSVQKPFHSEDVDEDYYDPYISRYMTEFDSWTAAGPVSTSTVENIDSTNNLPTELYRYRYSDTSLIHAPRPQKAPFQRTTAITLGHGNNQKPDEMKSPWREIQPHRDSPQPPPIRYSRPSPMQYLDRGRRVPSPPSTLKSSSIASGTTGGTFPSVSGSEYGSFRWKPDASQLPNPSYQLSMQTMQPSRSGYGVYASEACEQVPAMVAARLALAEQAFPSGPNSMAGTRPALAKQASYSRPKLDYQVLQSVQNPIHSEDVDQVFFYIIESNICHIYTGIFTKSRLGL